MLSTPPYQMCMKDAATYCGVGLDKFREEYMPHLTSVKVRGKKSRTILFKRDDLEREMDKDYSCKNQTSQDSTKTPLPTFGKLTSVSPVSDFEEALAQRTK